MKNSETLKKEITDRTNFIISDCNTFLLSRASKPTKISEWKTGGGNFLMAIGLFAALGFLAKTYRHLADSDAFVSEQDRIEIEKVISILKKENKYEAIFKSNKKALKPPRVGEVNETECFVRLVDAVKSAVDLGIPNDGGVTARKIWINFRNYLTHMTLPRSPVGAYGDLSAKNIQEIIWFIKQGKKSFYLKNKQFICNVDKLTIDVHDIGVWLSKKIDSFEEDKILATLKWMDS